MTGRRRGVVRASRAALLAGPLLLALIALSASHARADFRDGVAKHAAQDFAAARAEFEPLADLGDAAAQYNLGAMYLRGEGVARDRAIAIGWMLAAAENGYERGLARAKLDAARAELSAEDGMRADAVVARYGKAAIAGRVLPTDEARWLTCAATEPRLIEAPDRSARAVFRDGFAIAEFTVGVDGLARDHEIVLALPDGRYDRDLTEQDLGSRYEPAMRDGHPVERRTAVLFRADNGGGAPVWNGTVLSRFDRAATAGDPVAQYVIGAVALLDRDVGIDVEDARDLVLRAGQGGIPQAQYWVARQFDGGPACRDDARLATWLEHAAASGHARARALLAADLLRSGRADAAPRALDLIRSAAASKDAYAVRHALALGVDPAFAGADPRWMLDALSTLPPEDRRVDPHDDEAAAAALAANAEWPRAVAAQRRALERARTLAWNTSAIEERLAAYSAGRVWRGDLLAVPPRATPAPPLQGRRLMICDDPDCKRAHYPPRRDAAPAGK